MAEWGGFVRTKVTGGGNTVVAREVLQQDTPQQRQQTVEHDPEQVQSSVDTHTQPTIGMIIPGGVNKRAYLEHVRDFLMTQLSIVDAEIQKLIS